MTEYAPEERAEAFERQHVSAPELSFAVRALTRAVAEVDQELARRLELRPLDYSAMNHVLSSSDPLGAAELSARLGVSTGSATELVDRLERAGHLHRRPHPTDRRRKVLAPTDVTVGRVLTALRPLFERVDALADEFTPEEQAVIERYLRTVTGHFLDFAHPTPGQDFPTPDVTEDTSP